jgi:hypothetical protein
MWEFLPELSFGLYPRYLDTQGLYVRALQPSHPQDPLLCQLKDGNAETVSFPDFEIIGAGKDIIQTRRAGCMAELL